MSKNNKKSKKNSDKNGNSRKIIDDDSDEYSNLRAKPENIKGQNNKKTKNLNKYDLKHLKENGDYFPQNRRVRSDSIKLYKKHNKEKKNLEIKKSNNINIEDTNENSNIFKKNDKNIKQKSGQSTKKVTFLKPEFVTIIDVESYKKYNEENTYKDPFEDIDNNNIINNEDKENGKENVMCTCIIN